MRSASAARPSATAVNALRPVASLHWSVVHPATSIEAVAAQLATTGGAFSPDGHTVVLRTYTDAYLFTVAGPGPAAVARALGTTPRRLTLPVQPQGEGVAFRRDGRALVLTSEHKGSAVDQVPIPAARAAPAPTTAPPATTPGPAAVAPATQPPAPVRPGRSPLPAVVGAAAGVGVLALGAWLWRRTGPGS